MKIQVQPTSIIVIVVIFLILFAGINTESSQSKEIKIDKAAAEGYVAFVVNETQVQEEEEEVDVECDGSGFITHGDGHKTPCPGCSKCKSSIQEEEAVKKKLLENEIALTTTEVAGQQPPTESGNTKKVRSKQIILFTASWCAPCQRFKAGPLEAFKKHPKWIVSEKEDAMIRVVDVDKPSNSLLKLKYKQTRNVPEFVLLKNGKYVSHITGYKTANQIASMYNG